MIYSSERGDRSELHNSWDSVLPILSLFTKLLDVKLLLAYYASQQTVVTAIFFSVKNNLLILEKPIVFCKSL